MRVVTSASSTSPARTQPTTPFGFSGSWTRYHSGSQSEPSRAARTEKTVGTPLTFSAPKLARRRPPGSR